jgi:hypothetical protein
MIYETSLPYVDWTSATVVTVKAKPGDVHTYVGCTLSDGKRRSFTGDITIDNTGTGEGKLDTGTVAADTWYATYLVPKGADDDLLVAVASTNAPTSGPTGYSAFRYIGYQKTNSSSQWMKIAQRSNRFFIVQCDEYISVKSGAMNEDTWYGTDISSLIPDGILSSVFLKCLGDGASADYGHSIVRSGTSTTPTDSPSNSHGANITSWGHLNNQRYYQAFQEIPFHWGDDYIWIRPMDDDETDGLYSISGWTDRLLEA